MKPARTATILRRTAAPTNRSTSSAIRSSSTDVILFDFNDALVAYASFPLLQRLAQFINAHPEITKVSNRRARRRRREPDYNSASARRAPTRCATCSCTSASGRQADGDGGTGKSGRLTRPRRGRAAEESPGRVHRRASAHRRRRGEVSDVEASTHGRFRVGRRLRRRRGGEWVRHRRLRRRWRVRRDARAVRAHLRELEQRSRQLRRVRQLVRTGRRLRRRNVRRNARRLDRWARRWSRAVRRDGVVGRHDRGEPQRRRQRQQRSRHARRRR